ncbi:30751_t:CDS:2, partial [Racocetra persica]
VGLISEGEKENSELDKEGLLKIFQKYSISQMSLTTTVIGYYQTSGQTSLRQQELNNLLNTATPRNSNNTFLIASVI